MIGKLCALNSHSRDQKREDQPQKIFITTQAVPQHPHPRSNPRLGAATSAHRQIDKYTQKKFGCRPWYSFDTHITR
jgi:hypothetical protein